MKLVIYIKTVVLLALSAIMLVAGWAVSNIPRLVQELLHDIKSYRYVHKYKSHHHICFY